MKISVIIPVYNRPAEAADILQSLALQEEGGFEVILVEDGSVDTCLAAAQRFRGKLRLSYFEKPNGGPAAARNFGAARASGDLFVFLDSDCIVPPGYIGTVRAAAASGVEFYGGPDAALGSFTPVQRAINYAMTSRLTTGGIRGDMKGTKGYRPRSFNMGVARAVFERVGGFSDMRFGEDIDFSIRVIASGTRAVLLREAVVWHRRRATLGAFSRQLYFSGVARVNISIRHPEEGGGLLYALPAMFLFGASGCVLAALVAGSFFMLLPLLLLTAVWFVDSLFRERSPAVALLSAAASFVMLCSYGAGCVSGFVQRRIARRTEAETFGIELR